MSHIIPRVGGGIVSGDTHAASLTGSNSIVVDAVANAGGSSSRFLENGANGRTDARASADITNVETTIFTFSAITPAVANNVLCYQAGSRVKKLTADGTFTTRFKEGAVTIGSSTTGTITAGNATYAAVSGTSSDITVAAHTYSITIQASTSGAAWWSVGGAAIIVSRGAVPALNNSVTTGIDQYGGANATATGNFGTAVTSETTFVTGTAITPDNATNCVVLIANGYFTIGGAGSDITYRIKESTTTLASATKTAGGSDGFAAELEVVLYDVSVAAHTYTMTYQRTAGAATCNVFSSGLGVQSVAGLSGSDTHAASLTGSSGTCV